MDVVWKHWERKVASCGREEVLNWRELQDRQMLDGLQR